MKAGTLCVEPGADQTPEEEVLLMLQLWDPWHEFDRLRGDVDRLFGRYAAAGEREAIGAPA